MAPWIDQPPSLPHRPRNGHKGTFGCVLIVAGSAGMSGAAILAGRACLRSGAGLVTVATTREAFQTVALGHPSYMTTLFHPHDLGALLELCHSVDTVAIGPGLGQDDLTHQMIRQLIPAVSKPLVIDADALNALAGHLELLEKRKAPTILTPHPGEFARLTETSIEEIEAARVDHLLGFAQTHRCIVVLKGQETLVSDGKRSYRNTTGNPGMATGGSGDVLTGMIAALIHQVGDAWGAAALAVRIHGHAGDLAAAVLGETALISTDLIEYLPGAYKELEN